MNIISFTSTVAITMMLGACSNSPENAQQTGTITNNETNSQAEVHDDRKKAQTAAAEGSFSLPDLPYAYDALEPYIDEQTMITHHDKHFKGYTSKLNQALRKTNLEGKSITEILGSIEPSQAALRHNGGGYYNHKLYFESLSPDAKGKPEGVLMEAIERDFGSYEEFKGEFSRAATGVFGSGWAWLVKDEKGQLAIVSTANQDNPLMAFTKAEGFPLLGIDVWEHAYYLNYQNKRDEYVEAFFKVLDWEYVEDRFEL